MQELLNIMATTGIGLIILGASYALDLLVGCIKVLFTKSLRWSWKKMLEDLLKAILLALSVEAWVALWYVAGWYAGMVGLDISEFTGAMSITGMVGAIGVGAFWYLSNAGVNLYNFVNTKHIKVNVDESKADYEGIVDKLSGVFAKQEEESRPAVTPAELGGSCYYTVDVSTPTAFYNAVNGVGFNEGFGYQAHAKGSLLNLYDNNALCYKKIEDIEVGDSLYDSNMNKTKVVEKWTEILPVYDLKTSAGLVRYTPEHPLLVTRNRDKRNPNRNNFDAPVFIKVKDIKPTDRIVIAPAILGEKRRLTDAEAFLYGLWLGDGCVIMQGSSRTYHITIGKEKREKRHIDDYVSKINYCKYSQHSNGVDWEIRINRTKNKGHSIKSSALIDILDNSGRFSHGKKIVSNLTEHEAKLVLDGYMASDGYEKRRNNWVVTSVDKPLLLSVQQYAWALGYNAAINRARMAGTIVHFGKKPVASNYDLYCLSLNLKPRRPQVKYIDGLPTVSVISKKLSDLAEEAFHIEVSGDHVYLAENLIVHNCVAGFKEFQYSLAARYVSAGGAAKNYANEQNLVEPLGFTWHSGNTGFQNGDWAIWEGGAFGHVAMYYDGKWFGQNQGAKDGAAGTPFNLMSLPTGDIVGFYRPNIYNEAPKPEPKPEPKPAKFKVGDIVVPTAWVDYNGVPLIQYDPDYVITQISGDRAVLSANRDGDLIVWAAMRTSDIRKV